NTAIDINGQFDAALLLDAKSGASHYGLIFTQQPDDQVTAITANVNTSSAGAAVFQNSLALPAGANLVYVAGKGTQNEQHDSGAPGPTLAVSVAAPLKVQFNQASYVGRLQGP